MMQRIMRNSVGSQGQGDAPHSSRQDGSFQRRRRNAEPGTRFSDGRGGSASGPIAWSCCAVAARCEASAPPPKARGVELRTRSAVSSQASRPSSVTPSMAPAGLLLPLDSCESLTEPWKTDNQAFEFDLPNCSKAEFDRLLILSWRAVGATPPVCSEVRRWKSTVDTANRRLDRDRVETRHGLKEQGTGDVVFKDKRGKQVARGYDRIVYGDHGPYIEFRSEQICWEAFPHHKLKGPSRHYHEHYTADRSVKLYDQFNTVHDQPNPPPGTYSCNNNRPEGYADYRVGKLYISPDDILTERSHDVELYIPVPGSAATAGCDVAALHITKTARSEMTHP